MKANLSPPNSYTQFPDESGKFGPYGGRYVAETLMPLILEIENAYIDAKEDKEFLASMARYRTQYVGRPSPLYYAERLSAHIERKVYFKREELNHTGSHKVNNVLGQILLARRMGKTRIIAETGAGQHGVAVATMCALFDMECVVYMGASDIERQEPNVMRMRLLGAKICAVSKGSGSLKDALNEAMRDWVANVADTFYIIGTVAGPHPYPMMVRDFQAIVGEEIRTQIMELEGKLPDLMLACIGGGSNAIGMFYPFLDDKSVALIGVEAAGKGLDSGEHAASINGGKPAVLHGNMTYFLQDEEGQIREAHSISAGLDYPGIGPEHAFLADTGRVTYVGVTDSEALDALLLCSKLEGIIPALEPAHALAHLLKIAPEIDKDALICLNLCGRGDKDMQTISAYTSSS